MTFLDTESVPPPSPRGGAEERHILDTESIPPSSPRVGEEGG